MCTSLLRWRLNLALQVSQGSASTRFRWSGHFRHSFVKGLFRDAPSNFYWNRFIFDRQWAKNKLAQFFWDTVYSNKQRHLCHFFNRSRIKEYIVRWLKISPGKIQLGGLLSGWSFVPVAFCPGLAFLVVFCPGFGALNSAQSNPTYWCS